MASFTSRSSTLLPALVAAALAFSACGSDPASERGDELPEVAVGDGTIDVLDESTFGRIIAEEQHGNFDRAAGGFDLSAVTLPDETGTVFRLRPESPSPESIDQRVAALAAVLGVDGVVEQEGIDDVAFGGATRSVGTVDGTGAQLEVYAPMGPEGGNFSYTGPGFDDLGLAPCPTHPGGNGDCAGPDAPPASTAEAEATVRHTLDALGVADDSYIVSLESFGATAQIFAVFGDDHRAATDVRWTFLVGTAGSVELAQGPFTPPRPVADVALIDIDTAASRLDLIHGPGSSVGGELPPMTTILATAPTVVPETVPPGLPGSTTTTTTTTTISADGPEGLSATPTTVMTPTTVTTTTVTAATATTTSLPDGAHDPFPTTTPPVCEPGTCGVGDEPLMPPPGVDPAAVRSRTIVDVHATMSVFWESVSGPWLLPSYTFVADDGARYEIISVDADHIVLTAPPVTQPPLTTFPAPTTEFLTPI